MESPTIGAIHGGLSLFSLCLSLAAGDQLGVWCVGEFIGRGKFGEVRKGWHSQSRQVVAIKKVEIAKAFELQCVSDEASFLVGVGL